LVPVKERRDRAADEASEEPQKRKADAGEEIRRLDAGEGRPSEANAKASAVCEAGLKEDLGIAPALIID